MMFFLAFTSRHLWRHWRLNLVLLLGLTLAAGLLAGLPGYAASTAASSLEETLQSHDTLPAERNLLVESPMGGLSAAIYGLIEDALGKEMIVGRLQVRESELGAAPPGRNPPDLEKALRFQAFHLWSFEGQFREAIRIVKGRLPAFVEPPAGDFRMPPIEVAVAAEAAAEGGLSVGDRVTATGPIFFEIVGIIEPIDLEDDRWWGDPRPFRLLVQDREMRWLGYRIDRVTTLPLILPDPTMRSYFSSIGSSQSYWRVLMDWAHITIDNALSFQQSLDNLKTRLQARRIQLRSGLPKILADYQTKLATARIALFLLTAQAFAFILYTVGMITSYLLDRSQGELSTMGGRGGSRLQITLVFALEGVLLAILAALVLGPLLAQGAIRLYGMLSGNPVPSTLGAESLVLSLIAAGFGWLAIVLPVYRATRHGLLEWQQQLARPERLAGWQRLYLDLFLLIFGGLIYWQLSQAGSFVLQRLQSAQVVDPFLMLGSSLLLIAVALVFLRVFPLVLSLVAWVTKQLRGLVFSLGLARLARSPVGPSRVLLLISLAAGLALFTNSFVSSLNVSQVETAHYRAGADLRIARNTAPTVDADEQSSDLPGVIAASPVFRFPMQTAERQPVQMLAVDPQTFPQVAWYPAGTSNPSMYYLAHLIEQDAYTQNIPAIFSRSAVPRGGNLGTLTPFTLAGRELTLEVKWIVNEFPTLSPPFVVMNLPALSTQVELASLLLPNSAEDWLAVDPARYSQLIGDPRVSNRILADARKELRALQSDATAQGTTGAFQLNTLVLSVLSVAGFLLVHYFAARQRAYEFSLLRAMGLAPGQTFALLITEGILVVGMGLLAGTGFGYGLTLLMLPYLSKALAASLAGVTIHQVIINWPAVGQLYAILVGSYALAMVILLLALMRAGLHRVLRLGEE